MTKNSPAEDRKTVRTSVTLDAEDHETLQGIANRKKVSLAWVIREAVEKYLAIEEPLFHQSSSK